MAEKKESARKRFSTEKAPAILMESGNESEDKGDGYSDE